jgi:alginate O-acetyltransferase complex protein AlgI
MLFNTIDFVIFFVFVLAIVFIIKNKTYQHLFILGASYFFFYYTSNYLVVLLIVSTLLDYFVAKEIWNSKSQSKKKILLIISLAGNLGLLGFFKYADFAILQFNILGQNMNFGGDIPFLNLALPIGISFYTFQTISYTIDVYRGKLEPSKSLKEFALFIAFFPQLVAGPIVRASEFLPQLREKIDKFETGVKLRQIIINSKNLKVGITIMMIGFVKKMFFADNISPLVNDIFANPIGLDSFSIILATIGFGIQIYCDFSGYSDIAIGAALILGFKLPMNFNKPFFATSPADFWRRWHISLSNWVRDYLFFPIVHRNIGSDAQLIFGAMITFLLLGLWHGAGWNFIFFGLIHGIYVTIEVVIRKKIPKARNNPFFKRRFGKILAILGTQYLIFLAFIAFRVEDFDSMIYVISKYIFLDFQTDGVIQLLMSNKLAIGLIGLFIILHFIIYMKPKTYEKISELSLKKWTVFLIMSMSAILLFYNGNPSDFIYFKF